MNENSQPIRSSPLAIIRTLYMNFGPDWRTLLSGFLIVAAFPPWDLSFLIWIAPIPWLAVLERAPTWRRCFREGLWLSFFMTLGGYSWVAYSLRQFGNVPWSLAVLGLFFFGVIGQPQFHAYAMLRRWAKGLLEERLPARLAPWLIPGILAFFYTSLDWLAPKIFHDTFGHSLYNAPNIRQLAEYGGAQLLTLLIWWHAEALWSWIDSSLIPALRARRFPRGVPAYTLAAGILAASWTAGYAKKAEITEWTEQRSRKVRMSAIQANIGDFEKVASESGVSDAAFSVVRKYLGLTSEALSAPAVPDLVVWPETAYPSTFRTPMSSGERTRDEMVENFVRYRRLPLLFGGYDHRQGKDFNALFLLEPPTPEPHSSPQPISSAEAVPPDEPNRLGVYHKNVLLPFGEYIPYAENWEWFRRMFPQIGFFGRGIGPEIHEVRLRGGRSVKVAPIICYEALLPWYVLESALQGSEVILNITNDSWFGPFGEPELHLSLAAFRSIETRRSQFRATNTGISALVLPDGTITHATAVGDQTIMTTDVPILGPAPPTTLIMVLGDWFGPFSAFVSLLLLGVPALVAWWRNRR